MKQNESMNTIMKTCTSVYTCHMSHYIHAYILLYIHVSYTCTYADK